MAKTQSHVSRSLPRLTGVSALAVVAGLGWAALAAPSTPAPAPATPAPGRAAPAAPAAPLAPRTSAYTSFGYDRGITKPSAQSEMAFQNPGVVRKVMVKSGDVVKAGQLIAQQDDLEEQKFLAGKMIELEAAKWQIKAADADLAKKRVDLDRNEKLYAEQLAQNPKFSNSELDEARVNVQIGEIAVEYRKVEVEQKKAEIESAKVRVDHRKLLSPIDGVVARVDIHAGEGTDLAKPAGILIVNNDPLWVEVNVQSSKTVGLAKGGKLPVRYIDGGGDGQWVMGEVIYLADLGNAAANQRMVRLQMPNTARREAGLQVYVRLPEAAAPTAAAPAASDQAAAVPAAQIGR